MPESPEPQGKKVLTRSAFKAAAFVGMFVLEVKVTVGRYMLQQGGMLKR